MSEQLGMQHKKSAFAEWYKEVILKAELADYSAVSGCMVIRPYAYAIWELVQQELDSRFKALGVENAYFPLFIPESLLLREKEHVKGFKPEVAWVTHAGDTKLEERLAIRPTSETIMYSSYAKWIRSWRDLPLRVNQWCSVVRWEFKHAQLFLRTREFLWQEGHTAHATRESAEEELLQIAEIYREVCEDYMAIPSVLGRKSEKEKFAGAVYTQPLEHLMPDGWVIQGPDMHFLGQNFSKPFRITFKDQNEQDQYVYQNSWGFTTRQIGVMIAVHGDDKGLILPPRVAPIQVVIVPIYTDKTKKEVLNYAVGIKEKLQKNLRVHLDDRDAYSPGYKFNEWELKGVPLRIEIGPKEMETKDVMTVRRDRGHRHLVSSRGIKKEVEKTLEDIQKNLFERAKRFVEEHTKKAQEMKEFKEHVKDNRVEALWCGSRECEDKIKEETSAKISCLPLDLNQKPVKGRCVYCGRDARHIAYFGRSY